MTHADDTKQLYVHCVRDEALWDNFVTLVRSKPFVAIKKVVMHDKPTLCKVALLIQQVLGNRQCDGSTRKQFLEAITKQFK